MADAAGWHDVGGALVLHSSASRVLVNIGLVVGTERALVVDTGCGPRHATEILAAVRTVTALPLVVANTHAHWDHFFGNAVFAAEGSRTGAGTVFWAHPAAALEMAASGEAQRAFVAGPEPEMAAGKGSGTAIVLPTALLPAFPPGDTGAVADGAADRAAVLDLGGVRAELFTLGRGHTNGDLMVGVPGVLFAGDVLEEGAEPSYEDAFPAEWIQVLERLAGMGRRYPVMVPGHGRPVTAGFAAAMAVRMAARAT